MQLVILAAGQGTRFGGLKQLAPVGPNDEAIMDYTAAAAYECGYDGVVLVIRDSISAEIKDHVRRHFPSRLPVEYSYQSVKRGTAEAVTTAAPFIDGPFAVANADDLYGLDALRRVRDHFDKGAALPKAVRDRHVLVGYEVVRTVLTAEPVTRGLIEVAADGELRGIIEHSVTLTEDGTFLAHPLAEPDSRRVLEGHERVSMNLWGFHPRIFTVLRSELEDFDPAPHERQELLLPEVVGRLVTSGRDEVQVVATTARCIGITHAQDLALVRDELALAPAPVLDAEATRHP